MSDTEEVFISRSKAKPQGANAISQIQAKDTKPHIAREKLKEKRERLKKEKENTLIEEAKKRLQEEQTKKQQEEQLAKQQSEEKKKSDPTFALLMKMEEMMAKMNTPVAVKKTRAKKVEPEPEPEIKPKRQYKKKQLTREEEDEAEEEIIIRAKPAPKPRQKSLPKPKKRVVYLEPEIRNAPDTQFVGYDIAPPAEPIQYNQPSSLMSAMMNRRNMNGNIYY